MNRHVSTLVDAADLAALFRAANAGDAASYAAFLRAAAPVVRGVVRARGLAAFGEAACEDIVQDVLLAIHLKRHTWRSGEPVRPWLYAIARYKVIDAFRARGRRLEVPVEDFAEVLGAPAEADPTERADIERMLARLNPRAAAIVRGIGLDGATAAEIGARFGMTEGAVRVALHRALKQVADLRRRMME